MKYLIVKSIADNVGNALEDIAPHDDVLWRQNGADYQISAVDTVPFGFKMALRYITSGSEIICYGEPVGIAKVGIAAGECVHVHNVRGQRGNAQA